MLDESARFLQCYALMKTTPLPLKHSTHGSPSRLALLLIALALACFALLPLTYAQCPQNCSNDSNTGLGIGALQNTTTGGANTAIGTDALYNNTTGSQNTAIGRSALQNNSTGGNNTAIGEEALIDNTIGFYNTAVGD